LYRPGQPAVEKLTEPPEAARPPATVNAIKPAVQKTAKLYGWVAWQALRLAAKAWPVAFVVIAYALLMGFAAVLLANLNLGVIGGLLLGLLEALCISSYLYLLSQAVAGSRIGLADLRHNFASLFIEVIGILFILWVAGMAVGFLARLASERATFVMAAYSLAVAVFLNPVPEIIYQGRTSGRSTELVVASFHFIQQHWIEWFVPNILFGVLLVGVAFGAEALNAQTLMTTLPGLFSLQAGYRLAPSLLSGGRPLWHWPILLAVVHYAMVFRGVLFRELASGGWRVRAFRSFGR
jgi:hypothetical protein